MLRFALAAAFLLVIGLGTGQDISLAAPSGDDGSSGTSSVTPLTESEAMEILGRAGVYATEYQVTFKIKHAPDLETMSVLKSLPRLRVIVIQSQDADEIVKRLPDIPKLETLLIHDHISEVGVARIVEITTLKKLNIGGKGITDGQLGELHRLPNLTHLELSRTRVTAEGLRAFRALRPDVVINGRGGQPPTKSACK